ncbi:MAG: N-acetylmuramoyl-L-alanine amidase [Clostridiales bacterium]|nr:N-acetylmuramoyl-L-alanine amidase [Clostridiales bacterium]
MNRRRMNTAKWLYLALVIILTVTVIILAILLVMEKNKRTGGALSLSVEDVDKYRPDIDVELLTPNSYSRPQTPTDKITGIVIHYVANPGSSAIQNRNYFEGLKDSHETYASSNFVVGLEGEIVQCVPTSEVAYASNERNNDTVSIEVCHPDETGKFNDKTYDSLVWLTGWLCEYLQVPPENVIRHYDVTGKPCPLYFVEHEDAWEQFKGDVAQWIRDHQ